MMKKLAISLVFATSLMSMAHAIDLPTPRPLTIVDGLSSVAGRVERDGLASYSFHAAKGDKINVTLTAPTPSANFNVYPLGDPTAVFFGASEGTEWDGTIPADGDYEIRVYLMGQAAETGSANFTIDLALGEAGAAGTVLGDAAASGPDFWMVTGISPEGTLNVRSGPSSSDAVVARLDNGTVLRNLGCEGAGRARWCQVETVVAATITGWVSGAYLMETGSPGSSDALVEGTSYHATGEIECQIADFPDTSACPYGVIRVPGNKLASIFISLPNGGERVLEFRDGKPVEPPLSTMTYEQDGDLTVVNLDDGAEVYSVLDIVYLGD